jgi:hypothetical protein
MKSIYVEWIDAVADVEWQDKKEYEKPHTCYTLGFLQKKTKNYLVVCSTYSGSQTNARITIPRKWIIKEIEFKLNEVLEEKAIKKKKQP